MQVSNNYELDVAHMLSLVCPVWTVNSASQLPQASSTSFTHGARAGHYLAYVRSERRGRWLCCNDDNITDAVFGDFQESAAYVFNVHTACYLCNWHD